MKPPCCAPGVECKEHDHSKTLKKAVAEDLRTRGVLANKKQDELADASAGGDLAKMTEAHREFVKRGQMAVREY